MEKSGIIVCATRGVEGIQVGQLAYFAASVIWRASIYKPKFRKGEYRVNLGAQYEEQFRNYLLSISDFPHHASLMVTVSPSSSPCVGVWMPSGEVFKNAHLWRFSLPGIIFDLFVGQMIPETVRKMCVLRSSENLIFMTTKVDDKVSEAAAKLAFAATARSSKRAV